MTWCISKIGWRRWWVEGNEYSMYPHRRALIATGGLMRLAQEGTQCAIFALWVVDGAISWHNVSSSEMSASSVKCRYSRLVFGQVIIGVFGRGGGRRSFKGCHSER